eukprot:753871-Hanusia_phi.AAC.6
MLRVEIFGEVLTCVSSLRTESHVQHARWRSSSVHFLGPALICQGGAVVFQTSFEDGVTCWYQILLQHDSRLVQETGPEH